MKLNLTWVLQNSIFIFIGDFGQGVLRNGAMVAVKNLLPTLEFQEKQFKSEIDNLMRVRNENIVRFVGYCYETQYEYIEHNGGHVFAAKPKMLLCFEYMPNGSLCKYISGIAIRSFPIYIFNALISNFTKFWQCMCTVYCIDLTRTKRALG